MIVTALANSYVKNELEKRYENVYKFDLQTKEETLEFLNIKEEEITLITKENLDGNLDGIMYVKQIKLVKPDAKIIYIVSNLDNEKKKFLFANEIFNILEEKSLSLENIIECIDEDNKVIYKYSNDVLNEEAIDYNTNVITKKIISIYGTSGAGKSYVSSIISKNIAQDLNINVTLLDMDLQNPSIDIYNNLEVNNNGINEMVDDVDKKIEISSNIEKYMINDKNNKKLWYITNNTTIFDIQNKLSNKYYNKIYNSVSEKSDYTVIDLPSSPFLDVVPYTLSVSDYIFFVVNANYVSIRQAKKYLDLITKLWGISKDCIKIIINKVNKNSLTLTQIKSLFNSYEIVLEIPYIQNVELNVNTSFTKNISNINMEKVYKNLGIDFKQKSNNLLFKLIGVNK